MTEKENGTLLTSRERRFVGVVVCFAAAIVFVSLLGLVTWALGKMFAFFSGVIWPLAAAGILSIMLRPVVAFFDDRLRLGRTLSVLSLYGLVLVVSAAGTFLLAPKVISQVDELTQSAPQWPGKVQESLKDWLPEGAQGMVTSIMLEINESWGNVFDVQDESSSRQDEFDSLNPQEQEEWEQKQREMEQNRMLESLQKQGQAFAEKAGVALRKATSFLFALFKNITYFAIIPIYMFYFLGTRRDLLEDVEKELDFLRPSVRSDLIF